MTIDTLSLANLTWFMSHHTTIV